MGTTENATRTAIVTGASRGLGRALAAELVGRGWLVVGDGRDAGRLRDAARQIGQGFVPIAGDVADPHHRAALVAAAGEHLHLLVNNAGMLGPSPLPALADVGIDDVRATLDTNVVAPLALLQEALPSLQRAHGVVVNVTSDAAVEAYEGWGTYGLSKAALEQLTRVAAVENPDVRFHAVDPGDMRTEMHQAAFPGEDIDDRPLPETVVPAFVHLVEDPGAGWSVRVAASEIARHRGAA